MQNTPEAINRDAKMSAFFEEQLIRIVKEKQLLKLDSPKSRGNPVFSNDEKKIAARFATHIMNKISEYIKSKNLDAINYAELINSFREKEKLLRDSSLEKALEKALENALKSQNKQLENSVNQASSPIFTRNSVFIASLALLLPQVAGEIGGIPSDCVTLPSGANANCPGVATFSTFAAHQTSIAQLFGSSSLPQTLSFTKKSTPAPSTPTVVVAKSTSTSASAPAPLSTSTQTSPDGTRIATTTYTDGKTTITATNTSGDTTTVTIKPSSSTSAEATIESNTPTQTTSGKATIKTSEPTSTGQPTTTETEISTLTKSTINSAQTSSFKSNIITSSTPEATSSTSKTSSTSSDITTETSATSSTSITSESTKTTVSSSTTNRPTSIFTTEAITTTTPYETTITEEISTTIANSSPSSPIEQSSTSTTKTDGTTSAIMTTKTSSGVVLSTSATVTPVLGSTQTYILTGTTRLDSESTQISGYTTSPSPGTTIASVTIGDNTLTATVSTNTDGSYGITTSSLDATSAACSTSLKSLNPDSSHAEVGKELLLTLASIEHLKKINPDKIISSDINKFNLYLGQEGSHYVSEVTKEGTVNTLAVPNTGHLNPRLRELDTMCLTTAGGDKTTSYPPSPSPAPNSTTTEISNNSNGNNLPAIIGGTVGGGGGVLVGGALLYLLRRYCIKKNDEALKRNGEESARAGNAFAGQLVRTQDREGVIAP